MYLQEVVRRTISAIVGLQPLQRGVLTLCGHHSKSDESSCAQLHGCQLTRRGLWDWMERDAQKEFMTPTFTLMLQLHSFKTLSASKPSGEKTPTTLRKLKLQNHRLQLFIKTQSTLMFFISRQKHEGRKN